MRSSYLYGSLLGGVALAAFLALRPATTSADNHAARAAESGKSPTASMLPISQVVLFSSGVGYFQREGSLEGSQRVDLTFPVADINDLIKSMTLRDLDGGLVTAVSYDSNAPIERTLESYAINLTKNPTYGQILDQARGEKVEVTLLQGNATQPGTMTGSVIGVEKKTQTVNNQGGVVTTEHLNLWCADGMRSIKLSEVQRVRFLNAIMDSEFKKALETLALSHDTQKKAVSINFEGEGKRRVKVGYVIESPIWKTSYRLVLPKVGKEVTQQDKKKDVKEKDADRPFLQGWAVVENTGDEDWNNVRMALISGRPISFKMDLYDPLFIKRPTVEPELFASLRPVTYSGGLGLGNRAEEPRQKQMKELQDNYRRAGAESKKADGKGGGGAGFGGFGSYKDAANKHYADDTLSEMNQTMKLNQGVASAASSSKLGDYFQYAIDHAVTLPRQKSAMLPILNKEVQGDRVSIYNERVHAKFPLLGLVFKNTTGMNLTQGPITVYEGSNYAGDARILDLQKGEQRLLSYAIDLGTEVNAVPHSDNGKLTSVKIVKGIIHKTTKVKDSKTFTIVNRNDVDRVVLLEHPNRSDFKLTSTDKPWETASDVYRFRVNVPASKTITYTVSEEKDFGSQVQFTNSDDQSIKILIDDKATTPKVKEALIKARDLKWKLSETVREIQQVERQLKVITDDQGRLRQNIRELPPTSEAYKRYVKKFDEQETQIEKMQAQIKEMQDGEHAQRKSFENFLNTLTVE